MNVYKAFLYKLKLKETKEIKCIFLPKRYQSLKIARQARGSTNGIMDDA